MTTQPIESGGSKAVLDGAKPIESGAGSEAVLDGKIISQQSGDDDSQHEDDQLRDKDSQPRDKDDQPRDKDDQLRDEDTQPRDEDSQLSYSEAEFDLVLPSTKSKSPSKLQRKDTPVKMDEKKIIADLRANDNIGESIGLIFSICLI
jgi:hypothetical protein